MAFFTRSAVLCLSAALFFSSPMYAQSGSGHCLDFNGSSQYGTAGTFNLEIPQFTLMGWVYVDNFKTAFPNITSIMGIEQSGETALLRVGDASIPNNQVQFVVGSISTQTKLNSVTLLQTDRWYHLAATYDGSMLRLYINGQLDASQSFTGLPNANGLFEIARNYGNDRILDGRLDELTVWSTALSETTIRTWMCRKINANHPDYSDLMAYWPMNEGTGTSLTDESPNTNNATLLASPTWQWSGAHIGDSSVYTYSAPLSLSLPHPDGDFVDLVATGGSPDGFHLYRVDSVPNLQNAQAPITSLDTTRHWGVFMVGSGNYALTYDYTANPGLQAQTDCDVNMARKNNNASTTWTSATLAGRDIQADTMRVTHNASSQFIASYTPGNTHSLSFTAPTAPACFGDSTGSLVVTTQGGIPPYTYAWQDGTSGPNLNQVPGGWYVVTVTDGINCSSVDSGFIVQPPQLIAQANTNQDNTCEEDLSGVVAINTTGGTPPYTYLWDTPHSTSSTTIINLPVGTFRVTITDANACMVLDSTTVGFTFASPVPFLGNDTTICANAQLLLTPANGPYVLYEWSDNTSNTSLYVSGTGTTSVTVTDANGCQGSDSISYTEIAPKQVDLGNDTTYIGSGTVDAGSGFTAYDWSNGATTQDITVTQTGVYSVETTDSNGCVTQDQITITISPVGIEEASVTNRWRLYPNPTQGTLVIAPATAGTEPVEITVTDSRGALLHVQRDALPGNRYEVDLSDYPTGTYFVRIQTGQDHIEVRKVLLSR